MSILDIFSQQQPQVTPDQQSVIDLQRAGVSADSAGAMIGGLSHLQFGMQAQQAAQFQAAQLRSNAGQAQASAQRSAFDVDRQSQYVASAALASAAASGGGASDPTVLNLMARNAGEFAYRKSVALYQGEDRARAMNMQADAKEFEGGNTKANSTLVAGKFGMRREPVPTVIKAFGSWMPDAKMPRGRWYLKLRPNTRMPLASSADASVSPAYPVKRRPSN